MILDEIKNEIKAYTKLIKAEDKAWKKRCEVHRKKLAKLYEAYLKVKGETDE